MNYNVWYLLSSSILPPSYYKLVILIDIPLSYSYKFLLPSLSLMHLLSTFLLISIHRLLSFRNLFSIHIWIHTFFHYYFYYSFLIILPFLFIPTPILLLLFIFLLHLRIYPCIILYLFFISFLFCHLQYPMAIYRHYYPH
jgi:hypothetical protein